MRPSPLLIGVAAGLAGALLLAPATGTALGRLATARAERDSLRIQAAAPAQLPALLPPGLAVRAPGDVTERVQVLAKAGGVLVEEAAPIKAPAGVVALRVAASGPEKALLSFADALERGRPVMRLRIWRVEALPGGGARLSGELVAAAQ
ncbi:MAG: hypothetical protein J7500_13375 [Sphingomonas sp.]|uniref:hypothetical protein n=1 Tax=Sphingomonas sp. TaxID=28214 RepID=UPI001B062E1C|nr:hypothetical protein [Sphingomonas sp.]MBO9623691.1 hypothetical protein [Sphingomonas sp.]